ncbi:hypothetical protein APX70_200592 [Pseudomonas syringae pv. maculicola]|uniref:Uncharacterized protein n=1 Tax=Pseudomonas syringae pv. maculicola TaxID=59511 RepID=A0A3M2YEZ0_PSEYM|nr:hypothetical protein APX70_200592 [Pseudomonas syringae pv. maculicola]
MYSGSRNTPPCTSLLAMKSSKAGSVLAKPPRLASSRTQAAGSSDAAFSCDPAASPSTAIMFSAIP